jgi:hypothetical protein
VYKNIAAYPFQGSARFSAIWSYKKGVLALLFLAGSNAPFLRDIHEKEDH